MIKVLCLVLILPSALAAEEGGSQVWSALFQQRSIYFTSDRVTAAGVGGGIGAQVVLNRFLLAQADAGILWGNGNVVPTRLAFGIQRDGRWSPAILGTFSLLWGQRIEILSASGQRPAAPVWVVGLLAAPLRFEGSWGYASALELGYGIGPDRGQSLELTLLSVSARW